MKTTTPSPQLLAKRASVRWRGQDSNLRPLGYEPNELPLLHPAAPKLFYPDSEICQGWRTFCHQLTQKGWLPVAATSTGGIATGSPSMTFVPGGANPNKRYAQ